MNATVPLRSIVSQIAVAKKNLLWLYASHAPLSAYSCYLATFAARLRTRKYYGEIARFKEVTKGLTFTSDWFTYNIPHWRYLFARYKLASIPINILEIGSWEGQSSYYFLTTFPHAHLTCVDQWQGVSIQNAGDSTHTGEAHFDANLSAFAHRMTKYKGTSFRYYLDHPATPAFDLIYIDGSHYADDVLIDALQCFPRLKPGGLMIFDDYFYSHYPHVNDNAATAIHAFLGVKKGQYRMVHSYCQLVIQKLEIFGA